MAFTPSEFSQRVKKKYPEYADIDDEDLARKIVKKYPEYQSEVSFESKKQQSEEPERPAIKAPPPYRGGVSAPVKEPSKTQPAEIEEPKFTSLGQSFVEAMRGVGQLPKRISQAPKELSKAIAGVPEADPIAKELARKTKFVASGSAGVVSGIGGASKYLGLESIGDSITKAATKFQNELNLPDDPTFSDQVASGFGSMAVFMVPGVGIQSGAARLALMAPRLAKWMGVGTSAMLEAMTEAGGTYNEAERRGASKEDASTAATKTFWANLPTIAITNRLGLFGEKGGMARRFMTSALMEGSQEASQEIIQNFALNDPLLHNALTAGAVGMITGGGTKAVLDYLQSKPDANPQDAVNILMSAGIPQEVAVKSTQDVLDTLKRFESDRAVASLKAMAEAEQVTPPEPKTFEIGPKLPKEAEIPALNPQEAAKVEPALQEAQPPIPEQGAIQPGAITEPEAPPVAPAPKAPDAEFIGFDRSDPDQPLALFNITKPGHYRIGSTVSAETLQKEGLSVPEIPQATEIKEGAAPLEPPAPPVEPPAPPKGPPTGGLPPESGKPSEPSEPSLPTDLDTQRMIKLLEEAVPPSQLKTDLPPKRQILETTGIKPSEEKTELSQKQLLRLKFQNQEKGSKIGARFAAKEVRASLLTKMREQASNVAAVKAEIVNYVKEHLPKELRERFLNTVRAAKTPRDAMKAFAKVNLLAEKSLKSDAVQDIRKAAAKALESPSVAVDYKKRIQNILNAFDLKNRRQETMERLRATRAYLETQKAAGEDIYMPSEVLKELEALNRKPLDQITLEELDGALDKILMMDHLGRTKQASREAVYEAEKRRILAESIVSAVPIENQIKDLLTIEEKHAGKKLALSQELANKIKTGLDFSQNANIAVTPIDVLIDMMDKGGTENYTGAIFSNFKKPLDIGYSRHLNKVRDLVEPINKMARDMGFNEINFEKIGIYAEDQQEGGREHLLGGGLTNEFIDSIKLTENETRLYRKMQEAMDSLFSPIEETLRTVFNKEIKKVKNYFPFMRDFSAMSDLEVFERLGDAFDAQGRRTKKVSQGFVQSRKRGAAQAIRINALEIFSKHIEDAVYLVEMQEKIKMLSEVARTEEFGKAVGNAGQYAMLGWLDTMARNGGSSEGNKIPVIDMLRKNIGVAKLGFRISSTLIQPTSLFPAAARIGGNYVFVKALPRILFDSKYRKFVLDNMPEVRHRIGDSPEYGENQGKLDRAAFWTLQELDRLASMTAGLASYMKFLDSKGRDFSFDVVDLDGIYQAQLDVRRTQSSPYFKDLSLALTRGRLSGNRSMDKMALQFQSYPLNEWSLLRHDLIRAGIAVPGKRLDSAIGISYLMMGTLAAMGIRRGANALIVALLAGAGLVVKESLESKDDDDLLKDFVLQMLEKPPFLGQIVSALEYGSLPVPAAEVVKDLFEGSAQIVKSKKTMARTRGIVKVMDSLSSLAGVPGSSQAFQIVNKMLRDKKMIFPHASEETELEQKKKQGFAPGEGKRYKQLKGMRKEWNKLNKDYKHYLETDDMEKASLTARRMLDVAEGKNTKGNQSATEFLDLETIDEQGNENLED